MCVLILPVIDNNQCLRYIAFVMLLLVLYFELFLIRQFYEFDILKIHTQWNLQNNYYTHWFLFLF